MSGAALLRIEILDHAHGLPAPAYQTEGAAGLDLVAAIDEPVVVAPGARFLVPTGLRLDIPPGFEAQVRPRSGLALNHGVTVLNAPGTIDSDYRGEVMALLINHGAQPWRIARGDRIAQLVVAPVAHAVIEIAHDGLSATRRGGGGFGSTG